MQRDAFIWRFRIDPDAVIRPRRIQHLGMRRHMIFHPGQQHVHIPLQKIINLRKGMRMHQISVRDNMADIVAIAEEQTVIANLLGITPSFAFS